METPTAIRNWNQRSEFTDMVSANIRGEAARMGMNITALAKALGMSRSKVGYRWRDERAWQLDEIAAAAEIFGCEPHELINPKHRIAKRPSGTFVDLMGVSRARRDSNPQPSDLESGTECKIYFIQDYLTRIGEDESSAV